ncbi:hypothetical protein [Parageobacillus thermoglucosidasius]|uniref:Transposase IS116/IS110/IS902 family protein n=1 Tax=Geobacillus sp. (strain Y4.1MC1) TaxID=581103 RepID=A0A7U4DKX1_GEOS0|nr:hypothetical protein [Parageobacillus thermoglucosidasius]AEH47948.1 hypothetical protein Geoth_1998 [Parageobacillus thermoglucosidasius C56-YS93]
MKDVQKFVGFDVSKEMISVGVAEAERGEQRFYGNVPNNPESVRKFLTIPVSPLMNTLY